MNTRPERSEALRARVALVDGELWRIFSGRKASLCPDRDGYLRLTISIGPARYAFAAHRAIWFLHYGEWPKGEIDHINMDRTDNRLENLRDVTHAENLKTRRHAGPRRLGCGAGVMFHKRRQRWVARISIHGKVHHLGTFRDHEAALAARACAESEIINHRCGH